MAGPHQSHASFCHLSQKIIAQKIAMMQIFNELILKINYFAIQINPNKNRQLLDKYKTNLRDGQFPPHFQDQFVLPDRLHQVY